MKTTDTKNKLLITTYITRTYSTLLQKAITSQCTISHVFYFVTQSHFKTKNSSIFDSALVRILVERVLRRISKHISEIQKMWESFSTAFWPLLFLCS